MTTPIAIFIPMPVFLMVLIAAVIVLVGLAGVILLIVGLAKRRTALWVCGIGAMVLAGLALLVGVPAALLLCFHVSSREVPPPVGLIHPSPAVEVVPHNGGCSIRHADGRTTAHVEGVEIEILEPGSGRASSSSQTMSGALPGSSETRHEIGIGNVDIVVENRDGRLTLSVNGRACGPVHPGDSVLITPARDVLVNGQQRL